MIKGSIDGNGKEVSRMYIPPLPLPHPQVLLDAHPQEMVANRRDVSEERKPRKTVG